MSTDDGMVIYHVTKFERQAKQKRILGNDQYWKSTPRKVECSNLDTVRLTH